MRILKPLVVLLPLFAMTGVALAADLTKQPPMPTIAPLQPEMNWTGFYLGLNAGYGWTNAMSVTIADPFNGKSVSREGNMPGGFVGGAQGGYNWQSGRFVFGFEADIQYAALGGAIDWDGYDYLNLKSNDGQYFGTIRARLGYAMDRTLFYITGGYAYGGLVDNGLTGNATSNQGYALGGGFEYAFTDNWTARFEGLYINLDTSEQSVTVNYLGAPYSIQGRLPDGFGVVRAGVNYKF